MSAKFKGGKTPRARKALVATKAESEVAKALAREGVPFEQSALVAEFEVDFVVGHHIAIEVDGMVHLEAQARVRDRYKDGKLEVLGFTVLRITNDETRDRERLRAFAKDVRQLWEHERSVLGGAGSATGEPLLAANAALRSLKKQLLAAEQKTAETTGGAKPPNCSGAVQTVGTAGVAGIAGTDEELFREWITGKPIPDKDKDGKKP